MKPKEKIRPIYPPTQSGKSVYFCGTNPIEGVREPQGERSVPLSRSRGAALGAPLVTFPASGKSPGVEGRSALLTGECRGGCAPSHRQARGRRGGAPSSLGTGTAVPQKPQGEGAQRPPNWGAQRGSPRIKTKTILDSSAGLRYTEKKENRRNHHVRKKTGPQRSLLVRQPEKI